MENSAPHMRSQEETLATRWTRQQKVSEPWPEEEIIYLHLPSRTTPGTTYIFPLALYPTSVVPGKQ